MDTSVDNIMQSLINKDVLDTDKIDVLMEHYSDELGRRGDSTFFKVKSITVNEETLQLLNTNYVYEELPDFIPEDGIEISELHGDLADLNSLEDNSPGVARVANDIEISDEDIEDAFTNIVRNELKSELIALEEEKPEPEIETNKGPIEETDNNQTTQTKDDHFEWF
jgi:hypothetical protein